MRRVRWSVAVLLAAVLGACGPPAAGGSGGGAGRGAGSAADYDGQWQLTSGRSPSGRIPLPSRVTLVIDGSKLSGTSACNHYSATLAVDESALRIDDLFVTAMGCPAKETTAERKYVNALKAATAIDRSGNHLTLTGGDVDLRFEVVPPPEPVALLATTWHLNGLVEGRGPSGTVTDNEPATLTLHRNGTITGTTGCRRFSGGWEKIGTHYRTHDLAATGRLRCPAHRHGQDAHVLAVLDGEFTVDLRATSMDIYEASGDLGLGYSADG